jgi:hypothetical protein
MKVIEQAGIFKASRIAGPKHNYLGIGFSDAEVDVQIVEKRLSETDNGDLVDGAQVLKIVREVVESQTAGQERRFYVSLIEFVPTDTPDEQAYCELASAITRHVLEVGGCLQK